MQYMIIGVALMVAISIGLFLHTAIMIINLFINFCMLIF